MVWRNQSRCESPIRVLCHRYFITAAVTLLIQHALSSQCLTSAVVPGVQWHCVVLPIHILHCWHFAVRNAPSCLWRSCQQAGEAAQRIGPGDAPRDPAATWQVGMWSPVDLETVDSDGPEDTRSILSLPVGFIEPQLPQPHVRVGARATAKRASVVSFTCTRTFPLLSPSRWVAGESLRASG